MSDHDEVARQAERVVRNESRESEQVSGVRVHLDETKETKTPGFSRMRTDWHGPDAAQMSSLKMIADGRVMQLFPDAFQIMNDLFDVVREPEVNESTGEVRMDSYGFPVWKKNSSGAYIEDFTRLTLKDRENFLFRITTALFEWKQKSADLWLDAMAAKAMWEETMSIGFTEPTGRLTVEDRTQRGRLHSTEERYFAIFQSFLSRKSEALVESLELIAQRLKDTLCNM